MKKKQTENYLEKIPHHNPDIKWSHDQNGLVTLEIKNVGIANRIAQLVLKKPKISFIHLEEFGSFVWTAIDGIRDVLAIGELVRERFGDKAEPLYERLAQYIKTLESNKFITIN